jgi:hydroxymethylbilane synthase
VITIGSRGSKLALWQAGHIRGRLEEAGIAARIDIIRTTGDKITDVPLARLGAETSAKGLFTKELEEALLAGVIDLAVHSMKDMPTELPAGLAITAVPPRADPRDVLLGVPLARLPDGARVGTSALRREAQLRAIRPDLQISSLRGNIDTRIRKLREGDYDAIVLAAAGLHRLGWEHEIAEYLPFEVLCPAVGQGALAIETREGDGRFAFLDDPGTHRAVAAERAFLRAMGGGCQVPMGCHVTGSDLRCAVAETDGSRLRTYTGPADDIGRAIEAVR